MQSEMEGKQSHQSFFNFFLIFGTILIMLTPLCNGQAMANPISCPKLTPISPCNCSQFTGYSETITNGIKIDCTGKKLTNSQMNNVLDAFLAKGLSPVQEISASFNQLTKIPNQLQKFPALSVIDLGNNQITDILCDNGKPPMSGNLTHMKVYLRSNQIKRVPSGVFNFPFAIKVEIDLSENKITSVPSDAFRFPNASEIYLWLESNQIGIFPDGVFSFPSAFVVDLSLGNNSIKATPSAAVFNFPKLNSGAIRLNSSKIATIQRDSFISTFNAEYVFIDLTGNNITQIPCGAFTYPSSVLAGVYLGNNQITTVPSCAFLFPSAKYVFVTLNNNRITTISPGVFNFPSGEFMVLHLGDNQISVIPPGSFAQGIYLNIILENNRLTRFESTVFKAPLNRPNVFTSFLLNTIVITGNPIDCLSDPCHLAWLLKSSNNSELLDHVQAKGICSTKTGSSFSVLSSFDFNKNCPCSYNY